MNITTITGNSHLIVKGGLIIGGVSVTVAGATMIKDGLSAGSEADEKLGKSTKWGDQAKAIATQNNAIGNVGMGLGLVALGVALVILGAGVRKA